MRVSEIRVKRIRVNQGLGVDAALFTRTFFFVKVSIPTFYAHICIHCCSIFITYLTGICITTDLQKL